MHLSRREERIFASGLQRHARTNLAGLIVIIAPLSPKVFVFWVDDDADRTIRDTFHVLPSVCVWQTGVANALGADARDYADVQPAVSPPGLR